MNNFYPWIIRIVIYCLLLEVFYLAAANMMLSTGILYTLLNRRPQKLQVEWQSAWSVIPGFIHITGFKLRNRTPSTSWNLDIDQARLHVSLPALLFRSFRVSKIRVNGVSAEIYRLPKPTTNINPDPDRTEIALASFKSVSSPLYSVSTNPGIPAKPKWRIKLDHIAISEFHQIDVNGYVWSGNGHVEGSLDMMTRDRMHVTGFAATLRDGIVHYQGKTVSEKLTLTMALDLGPYIPHENRGRLLLNHLAGHIKVDGYISHIDFLRYYFQNTDWLAIDGTGEISADLYLEKGLLRENSALIFQSGQIQTRMKDWEISGTGQLDGSVSLHEEILESRLKLNLRNISVSNQIRSSQPVHGPGLNLSVIGRNIRLDDQEPDLNASIDLVDSTIDDLSVYNNLFPLESGFEILNGSRCTLQAHIDVLRGYGKCRVEISGNQTGIRFRDQSFRGDLQFSAELRTSDPQIRIFRMTDMLLKLSDVNHISSPIDDRFAWSASVSIPDTLLIFSHPISLESKLEATLSDSYPLTSVFLANQQKWFQDFLVFKNLSGQAGIIVSDGLLRMRDVTLSGTGFMPASFGVKPFGVSGSCASMDLKSGVENLQLSLQIPPSTIPDLAALNSLLPENSGLEFRPGDAGSLKASLTVRNSAGSGKIQIDGSRIGLKLFDQSFETDLAVRIGLKSGNILNGVFDLAGSSISLENASNLDKQSERGWWSKLESTRGSMKVGKPLSIEGDLRLSMRDSGPLIAIFEEQSRTVRWLGDVLLVKNISGDATIRSDSQGIRVNHLQLSGDKLDIQAKLQMASKTTNGILHLKFMGFSMGVELKNGRKSYRLIRPEKWFERYPWPDN